MDLSYDANIENRNMWLKQRRLFDVDDVINSRYLLTTLSILEEFCCHGGLIRTIFFVGSMYSLPLDLKNKQQFSEAK